MEIDGEHTVYTAGSRLVVGAGGANSPRNDYPGWVAVERTEADFDDAEAFLAGDDGGYDTGANRVVDCGCTAVMQDDALPEYRPD